MSPRNKAIFAGLFILLPLVAAGFDWSLFATAIAVLVLLVSAWLTTLRGLAERRAAPDYELETISMSHFAEKVRWCMDVLGVDYRERTWAGTLGAFYLGRTVPKLSFQTGSVRSTIGNSAEILRYLWGAHSDEAATAFLEPDASRRTLETRTDKAGVALQIWVYHHILDDRDVALRAWGVNDPRIPGWQLALIKVLFPLQRFLIRKSFRIDHANYERSCHYLDEFLADIETRVSDGRQSILGGKQPNYTDYAFAAIMGLWIQPSQYGGAMGVRSHIADEERPSAMREDIARWREDYPKTVTFVEALYDRRIPEQDE